MSKIKGKGKTSKPCLTREVIHKRCVKIEMQKYTDGISVHQYLIFLVTTLDIIFFILVPILVTLVTILNKRRASGSPPPQYYHSLAQSTAELSRIQTLLNELQVPFNTPIVLYDNQNVLALPHKPILHARIKHMDIDVFFVREKVLTK